MNKSQETVLTPKAEEFLGELHRRFNPSRLDLLERRAKRQEEINRGKPLTLNPEGSACRADPSWKVAPVPGDLKRRWVEITGPTDRKMVINALNSGADVFMADFEDANSPTFANMIEGQRNLMEAVEGTISLESPEGKTYALKEKTARLFVRPRGLHLEERHFLVDGKPISASLFDFGLFLFHNAKKLIAQGKTPAFYLSKLESFLEARFWSEVFSFAEEALGIPHGTLRATVLIETLPAAFEMEEILYELKDYSAGLNAGRWDYIFSIIKTFQKDPDLIFPDRSQITMTVPFMRAYAKRLVEICRKRGAYAIGGMAAFIPNKNDPEVTEKALRKVREDKLREVRDGFDGTWVAHPALVPIAHEVFAKGAPAKQEIATVEELLDFSIPGATITEEGLIHNIDVTLQYLYYWLKGRGAVGLYNLMEDMATAEISRSQVWQWLQRGAVCSNGKKIDRAFVKEVIRRERAKLEKECPGLETAAAIIEEIVFDSKFVPFLTLTAYKRLEGGK